MTETVEPLHAEEREKLKTLRERIRAGAVLHWPLILILVFSATVGFWRLPDRGSVFIDEGYQQLESTWVQGKLHYVVGHLDGKNVDLKRLALSEERGLPLAYGKPLHSLLGAIALTILPGHGPTPILILDGLLGLGTIALIYFIAFRLRGRLAAAGAAAVLGSSAYWLAYRRSGLPEADSVFFFALALWALVAWSDRGPLTVRRALVVGVATGMCFTSNDRWYISLPLILASYYLLDSRHGAWRKRAWSIVRRVASIAAGFLIPIAFFEAVYSFLLFAAHDVGALLPYKTYLQQLYGRFRLVTVSHHAGPSLGQIAHSPYPGYLHAMEGIVWLLVIAAALIFIAVRWRREHALALMFALGPVLLASSSRVAAPRYMSLSVPGIALAAGFGLAAIGENGVRAIRIGGLAVMAAALASSLVAIPQVLSIRGEWDPAVAVVRARGGALISPKGYSLADYVGLRNVRLGWQDSIPWALDERAHGARWVVLELFVPRGASADSRFARSIFGPPGEFTKYLLAHEQPIVSERFHTQSFIYEGIAADADRLILLYPLTNLPPATS